MSTGTRVDSTTYPAASGNPFVPSNQPDIFARSDGTLVCVYLNTSGSPYFATRSTAGIWTDQGAIATGLGVINSVSACQTGDIVSIVSSGTISSADKIAHQDISATNVVSTQAITNVPGSGSGIAAAYAWTGSAYQLQALLGNYLYACIGGSGTAVWTSTTSTSNIGTSNQFLTNGTTSVVLYGNSGTYAAQMWITTNGTFPSSFESFASAYPPNGIQGIFDQNGNLDFVYQDNQNQLLTRKRTATNTFTGETTLDTGLSATGGFSCAYNPSSGDLWVYYTKTNYIYVVKRTGGVWGAPIAIANATATFAYPTTCTPFAQNGAFADVIFHDTTSPAGIYHVRSSLASAPYTPNPLAPSGTITTLVPAFSFQYSNVNPNDTQGSYEITVHRVSDNQLMFDTGQQTSSANSGLIYNGTALAYGTAYNWQVQVWDTLSNQPSGYSNAVTFTPRQGPVVTNASLQSIPGGTVQSTATPVYNASTTTMAVGVSVTNASGAAIASYKNDLLASDAATVLQTAGPFSFSHSVPDTFVGNAYFTDLVAGNNYYIRTTVTDANSLSGVTPVALGQWEIYVVIPNAASPTSFSATPNPTTGVVNLSWTNPQNTASATVFRRPTGTTAWTTLSSGTLRSSGTDFPNLNTAFDYGVQITDNTGLISVIVTDLNNTVGLLNNHYGVWLNDISNPAVNSAALGLTVDWASGTLLDLVTNSRAVVPAGRARPIVAQDLTNYYTAVGRTYSVPDLDGIQVGPTIVAMLAQFAAPPFTPLLYRDPTGQSFICFIAKFHREIEDAGLTIVSFDISQIDNTSPVFV